MVTVTHKRLHRGAKNDPHHSVKMVSGKVHVFLSTMCGEIQEEAETSIAWKNVTCPKCLEKRDVKTCPHCGEILGAP